MTQLRCTLFALLGLTLAACGEDKTIVSVNYSYGEGIAGFDTVHTLITQNGQKYETTFATPQVPGTQPEMLPDGGDGTGMVAVMINDNAFFQRYELEGFKDGEAVLKVELLSGSSLKYTEETTFDVREGGAVAAHAGFAVDPPAVDTGSTGDTGAASDTGAAADTTSAPDTAASSAPAGTSAPASSEGAATSAPDAASSAPADTSGAATADDSATADAATSAATDAG